MMARSARPVLERVWVSPVAMDNTEISTATTPAIPMTMTNEDTARAGRLRRFMAVTAITWLKVLMGLPLTGPQAHRRFLAGGPAKPAACRSPAPAEPRCRRPNRTPPPGPATLPGLRSGFAPSQAGKPLRLQAGPDPPRPNSGSVIQ